MCRDDLAAVEVDCDVVVVLVVDGVSVLDGVFVVGGVFCAKADVAESAIAAIDAMMIFMLSLLLSWPVRVPIHCY